MRVRKVVLLLSLCLLTGCGHLDIWPGKKTPPPPAPPPVEAIGPDVIAVPVEPVMSEDMLAQDVLASPPETPAP